MSNIRNLSIRSLLFAFLVVTPVMAANAQTTSYSSMTKQDCDSLHEHKTEFSTREYKQRLEYCKSMEKKLSGRHPIDPEKSTNPENTGGATGGPSETMPQ
ncbi:MAG TPA: hypothetical protein VFT64_02130 [Rickettsiales bacterium]|nr:hypothetical protein [Rickettsiales bacterium]